MSVLIDHGVSLEDLRNGQDRPSRYTVADLADMAEGCAMGVIVGAKIRQMARSKEGPTGAYLADKLPEAVELARAAMLAHSDAIKRAIDAIK